MTVIPQETSAVSLPEDQWAARFADTLLHRIRSERRTAVTWLNHFTALQDLDADIAVREFDLIGVDGVFLRRIIRVDDLPRTSADLVMPHVLKWTHPVRIGLIGSTPENLEKARRVISSRMPNPENLVFAVDGYGARPTADDIAAHAGRLDLLVIGLGAPQQDAYALELNRDPNGPLCVLTCGGWLDQISSPTYYPDWAYRFKLNWAIRLVREPRRLWRRYTVEAVRAHRRRHGIRQALSGIPGIDAAAAAAKPPSGPEHPRD